MMAAMTQVLVVDDEPMVREVLARYLEAEGFAVSLRATASRRSSASGKPPRTSCSST